MDGERAGRRSQIVDRDYEGLVTRALDRLYPDKETRRRVEAILARFGGGDLHRVRLGILKAAKGDVAKVESYTELAIVDWRDLLVEAEYPRSFGNDRLDNEEYDKLVELEQREYDDWLHEVLSD